MTVITHRPLTVSEQSMLDRHTAIGPQGQPRIVIDQQSFDIDNAGQPWALDRAEWYRRQIAIALARLADEIRTDERAKVIAEASTSMMLCAAQMPPEAYRIIAALHTDAGRAAADMGIPISEPAQPKKGGAA